MEKVTVMRKHFSYIRYRKKLIDTKKEVFLLKTAEKMSQECRTAMSKKNNKKTGNEKLREERNNERIN